MHIQWFIIQSIWGKGVKGSPRSPSVFQQFSPPPGPPVNYTDKHVFNQRWGWKSVTSAGVVFGWKEIIHAHRSSPAHDCPAVLYSNQQWELNRFVNFPGDFHCLGDLVVESGWIRFAERQSIHSFRALLSRDVTSEAWCVDNGNLISSKQICPIFNNLGTPPNLKDKHRFRARKPLV